MTLKRVRLGTDSSGRPVIFDERMAYKVALLRKKFPKLVVVQGSYSNAKASADTHAGGGSADFRSWNLTRKEIDAVVRYARAQLGLVAWYRTKAQGFDPHIHAIDAGNPTLSAGAARQVTAFHNGRNGLASNGPDDGPRVKLGVVTYPPKAKPRNLVPPRRYVVTADRLHARRDPSMAGGKNIAATRKKGFRFTGRQIAVDPESGRTFIRAVARWYDATHLDLVVAAKPTTRTLAPARRYVVTADKLHGRRNPTLAGGKNVALTRAKGWQFDGKTVANDPASGRTFIQAAGGLWYDAMHLDLLTSQKG